MCCHLTLVGSLLSSLSAPSSRRKTSIKKQATPPIGTLLPIGQPWVQIWSSKLTHIQKHHLQLAWSVRAPPRIGPKHVAKPKTLTTMPKYRGLLVRGTVSPIIPNAPWKMPAAPTPAIARPTMNAGELGAAALRMEPAADRCQCAPTFAAWVVSTIAPSKIRMETR